MTSERRPEPDLPDPGRERGEKGETGARGASSPYARRNALILYVFTASVFLALIIRGEVRDDHIAELQRKNRTLTNEVATLQAKVSDEVLCPLYGLLVEQIDRLTPKQLAKPHVQEQIDVIQKGYKALACKPPK